MEKKKTKEHGINSTVKVTIDEKGCYIETDIEPFGSVSFQDFATLKEVLLIQLARVQSKMENMLTGDTIKNKNKDRIEYTG